MKYKEILSSLLEQSAVIASGYFGKVGSSVKPENSNQVLTKADLEIGNFLVSQLKKEFPSHNIIDEESGVIDNGSNFTWVIDPIDGTSNFALGIPNYGVIVGLLENDLPVAGSVALPFFNEIYYAEKGLGAYVNDRAISVSKETDLMKTLVAYGIDSHLDNKDFTAKEMEVIGEIVSHVQNLRCSNSVYDAMMVAEGKYGGYINQSMRIWDVVGAQIIIEEAGGTVTAFSGLPMDYANHLAKVKEHFTFFSASNALHPKLLDVVVKV